MAINTHTFDRSGALVSSGVDAPDDDGAPPVITGMRVHKDDEIDTAGERPPTQEEMERLGGLKRPKLLAPKAPKAPPAPKPSKAQEGFISDRRRCLELAVESGAVGAEEILATAERFKTFLEA